jgi:hypothetical protein
MAEFITVEGRQIQRSDVLAMREEISQLREQNRALLSAVRAFSDAADVVATKAHIVQPFLSVFKAHRAVIRAAQEMPR